MYFVTGASGKLGQLVAAELAKHTAPGSVTLGSRHQGKLEPFARQGFRTAAFDFDKPASLREALKGHQRLLLISGDSPTEERIAQHKAAIDAAKASGITSIVYTSFTNAAGRSLFTFAKAHAETEAHIKVSGLAYTFLRNNQYAENLASALAHAKETGSLAAYGSKGKVAYLPRADVAAAAVTALIANSAGNAAYEITGPKSYDTAEIAQIVSRKWGKEVTAVELPRAALASILAGAKLPDFLIDALISLHEAAAAGEMAAASGDYEKLTGRRPESLETFLTRTA
jgi:NAD(P)H dehydrogenase (quinone)